MTTHETRYMSLIKLKYFIVFCSHQRINMAEPWYQSERVTSTEATTAVHNHWFCNGMRAGQNSFESNQQLATKIRELSTQPGFGFNPDTTRKRPVDPKLQMRIAASNATRVTFESLRHNNPHWNDVLAHIISEELQHEHAKYGGFGSHRGFYTFVFKTVCDNVLARAIVELWARPILTRRLTSYVKLWIERRFEPGAPGFIHSESHFKQLVSQCS